MWMAAPPGPAGAAAEHVPFGEFVEVADHGLAVDLGVGLAGVLEEAVERVDRGRRQRGADHARFVQGCDKEGLAAGIGQRARDLFGAAAIGVRLDHAGAFGRHRRLLELAPVGDDGVEVDGQDAGGGCKRRRLVRLGREQGAWRDRFGIGCDVHAAFYAGERRGSTAVKAPKRFQAKWIPVRVKKTRQTKASTARGRADYPLPRSR